MPRVLIVMIAWALGSAGAQARSEIHLWHSQSGSNGVEIEALVARFNSSQNEFRVVPAYRPDNEETLRAALAARKSRRLPHIVQFQDTATADVLSARGAVRPLWQVMSEAGLALDPAAYVPAVASYYSDTKGRLLALPIDNSTPVLYYNRDAFRRAGLDPNRPPRIWNEMVYTLDALVRAGSACAFTTASPSWVLLENMSAWHNEEFATHGNGLGGANSRLAFNTGLMMRWISTLSTWAKSGYFTYSGRDGEGEARFASGECAILTASSASERALRRAAKFDLGVTQFPYYDDFLAAPQNTLVGGSGLWVMDGARREEIRGAAKFIAFLLRPEVQTEWHQKTGYVPLVVTAYEQSKTQGHYRDHPASLIAVRQLLFRNPTRDTRGIRLGRYPTIRSIIDEELETVWSGKKAPMSALDAAVKRGNMLLRDIARTTHGVRTAEGGPRVRATSSGTATQ